MSKYVHFVEGDVILKTRNGNRNEIKRNKYISFIQLASPLFFFAQENWTKFDWLGS